MKVALHEDASEKARSELQKELNRHPGYLIRRLQQISVSVFLAEAEPYDLTQLQFASLSVIDGNPGIDQRRLGRSIALDRQTVSTVVRRLTEKGLVRKEIEGRKSALYPTGAGKALYQVMRARLGPVDNILLGPLSAEERNTFLTILGKLVNALNGLSRAPQVDIYQKALPETQPPKRKSSEKGRPKAELR